MPEFRDGEDPDDAFSSIPYDKGANFLLYLERVVGGLDVFAPYIQAYFTTFQGRSISTEEWKAHLLAYFATHPTASQALQTVDWDAWLHGEGLELPVRMEYDQTLAAEAFALAARWIKAIGDGVDGANGAISIRSRSTPSASNCRKRIPKRSRCCAISGFPWRLKPRPRPASTA